MNAFIEFCQAAFSPVVFIFTVSNLATMGLQVNMSNVIKVFQNKKILALIFAWGWVVGPALGYLITLVIPMAEPFAITVILCSLAPCAPFLQQFVGKGRGDMDFAGGFIPLVAVGTVVLMPLMAPLLIKGIKIDTWAIAQPLLLTILLPLVIGTAIRHYADTVANKIFPAVKWIAVISTLTTIALCFVIYGPAMLATAGSFALLSMTLFMLGMGLLAYRFGFGLKQSERSVMSLGMGTRNIAAALASALSIPNVDPRIVTMIVMWTLWSFILSIPAAKIFARLAGKTVLGPAA